MHRQNSTIHHRPSATFFLNLPTKLHLGDQSSLTRSYLTTCPFIRHYRYRDPRREANASARTADARLAPPPTNGSLDYLCGAKKRLWSLWPTLRCLAAKVGRRSLNISLQQWDAMFRVILCSVMVGLITLYCHQSYSSPSPRCGAQQAP